MSRCLESSAPSALQSLHHSKGYHSPVDVAAHKMRIANTVSIYGKESWKLSPTKISTNLSATEEDMRSTESGLYDSKNFSPAGSKTLFVDGAEFRVRAGGLKEARLKSMMPIHTGRYFEATVARGEEVQDLEAMHSLRIDNLPDVTTEETLRTIFREYGPLGDVYRPVNKDKMKYLPLFFVRFLNRDDMIRAMMENQGKVVDGRPMSIREAVPGRFKLATAIN